MVDWKREIKLSELVRRPKEAQSRERKKSEPTRGPESRGERRTEEQNASFWKKEISFRRKPKALKPPERRKNEDTDPEPIPAKAEATPFWKKEISFGRKPKEQRPATASATPLAPANEARSFPPADAAEQETWATATVPDEPSVATEHPVMPQPPAEGLVAPKRPRLRGLSVPRPKLPGRPMRRTNDERKPRRPASEWRRSFDKLQSFRAFFERQRRRTTDDAPSKTGLQRVAGKLRRPTLRRPTLGRQATKQLVGLKIGASQLAAAQVVNNGVPELVQVAREPLEPGIVVGGEPRDFDALVASLQDFFRKHRLPRRGVRLGIANNRIGVRSFEISGIDDSRQLANAVKFRAQEVLPIPLDRAVMDYQVLEERVDSEGISRRRILLVVAYRDLIERYVAACRQAGIKLVGIDLEAFALLRAVASPSKLPPARVDAALVVVSIGHEQSTFALSDGHSCDFTRVFDWGGASLNIAIARALDITPSQAEPIKRSLTLRGTDEPVVSDDRTEKAREVVLQQLEAFARDLVSSLRFYQNQPGALGIGEIVLTGGTAHLPGLPEELQRLTGVPARLGDPLGRVKTGKRLEVPNELGSLSVAIGLGMEA
jgi:type IV pilus assembly protein PilM